MGKKHGFRGTPLRPSKLASGMGRMFDARGDPMVSPREGREKFGRNLETENPDFDRYFAEDRAREDAVNAALKASQIDKGNAFRKALVKQPSVRQRAANVILAMEKEMRKSKIDIQSKTQKPYRVKGSFYYFPDQTEKLKDEPQQKPRPFFGKKA